MANEGLLKSNVNLKEKGGSDGGGGRGHLLAHSHHAPGRAPTKPQR